MKKSLSFVLAASVVIAASCAKSEPAAQILPESDGFKSLSVSTEATDVKTALGDKTGTEYAMVWKAGDAISVNGTASQPLAADVAAGTPAQFMIAETITPPYNVIYPASAVNEDGTVTIPSIQAYSASQFDPAAAIMTGYTTGSSVTMKVACAFVKVSIARAGEEAVNQITLFSNGDEVLSGTFAADCSAGTLTYKNDASNGVTMTSVAYDAAGKIQAVFTIPAATYSKGFSVLVTTADGKHMGRKAYGTSGVTLQSGSMLAMPEFPFSASSAQFSGGEGTKENPYIISKTADLVELSSLCNDTATNPQYHAAFYKQVCDIDLTGIAYKPVCVAYKDATAFTGCYDGGGHRVVNMTDKTNGDTSGLIGYVMGGTIKNVVVENAVVEGVKRVGIITGTAWKKAVISDCKVINSSVRSASGSLVGGIVGYCNGSTVKDCEAIGSTFKADANYAVGPIVGELYNNGTITGCAVSGCEVFAVQCAGGIAGRTYGGQISKCVVKGKTKITTTERSAGGITGGVDGKSTKTTEDLTIDNCLVADGTVIKSLYYSGGIAGYIYPGDNLKVKIKNCGIEDTSVCTQKDDGSAHKGDCCIGGAVGWLRNSSGNSEVLLINNYFYYADGGCKVDEEGITNLAIAGVVGYISNSATSHLEIAGNCTDLAKTDIVIAGKVYDGQDTEANKIGSVYGHCAHDQLTMNIYNNYWANDTGIPTVGHGGLSNVLIEDNEGFASSVFRDGTTVVAKLNAFKSYYEAEYEEETLNSWTVKDNRPVLEFNF